MVVDYKVLNKFTKKSCYPTPNLMELVEKSAGHKYYYTLDATSFYHQLPMRQSETKKTAFNTSRGKFECQVMPFGLCTALFTCQRKIDFIVSPHREYTAAYFDDIIIFADTPKDNQQRVEVILNLRQESNISLE